jgi:hypothetical protein
MPRDKDPCPQALHIIGRSLAPADWDPLEYDRDPREPSDHERAARLTSRRTTMQAQHTPAPTPTPTPTPTPRVPVETPMKQQPVKPN